MFDPHYEAYEKIYQSSADNILGKEDEDDSDTELNFADDEDDDDEGNTNGKNINTYYFNSKSFEKML